MCDFFQGLFDAYVMRDFHFGLAPAAVIGQLRRPFQFDSRVIQTQDQLMQIANEIRH